MTAAVTKAQARSCHQVLYGARHQYLARAAYRRHARADVHGDAADVIAHSQVCSPARAATLYPKEKALAALILVVIRPGRTVPSTARAQTSATDAVPNGDTFMEVMPLAKRLIRKVA
jgi:hypothetical protein